jgi:hypothetical protein
LIGVHAVSFRLRLFLADGGGELDDELGAPIDGVHYFQLMASSHSD